jgi:hypothetical protein
MNQTPRRLAPLCLTVAIVLATVACQKKKAPEEVTSPLERVGSSPLGTSQVVMKKTVAVKASTVVPFEIPAHAAMPHLRGNYKSFVTKLGVQANAASANVDFFVLTEDQYADFVAGTTNNMIFSVDASHDQGVDVSLPPSINQPEKFYLVFRSSPGSDPKKVVQADLQVDF